MAITWRSLMGQNPDPVRAMSAAQDSFDGMFSSLNGALTKYQNQQLAQENKLKSDNLEGFYSAVASKYTTPEAFQAAVASGELQGLADGFGTLDKSKVRELMETRGKDLQDRTQSQWAYDDKVRSRSAEPFVDDIRSRIAAGDFTTAKQLLEENTLPNEAALYEVLRAGQDRLTDRGRADTRFGWEEADRSYTEGKRNTEREGEAAADSMLQATLAHRANIVSLGQEQGNIAKELNLPVTSNGLPDMAAISASPEALAKFKQTVAEKGLQMPGDTEAFNTAIAVVQQSGAPASVLLPLLNQGELFNTTQGNMLVGAEKAALERNLAQIDKEEKEIKEKNSLYLSSKNVVDQLPKLNAQLKDAGLDDDEQRKVAKLVRQRLTDYPDQVLPIQAIVSAATTSRSWGDGFWDTVGNPLTSYTDSLKENFNQLIGTEAFTKQQTEFDQLQQIEARLRRAREEAANSGKVPYR